MALNLFTMFNNIRPGGKKDAPQPGQTPIPDSLAMPPAQKLAEGMINVRDVIAPSAIEVDFDHIRVGTNYYKTLFVSGYPRFVGANWLSPIINFDHSLDISMFYYPVKSKMILDDLRRKITELEATMMSTKEKGRITDPVVSAALDDAKALQEQLVKGVEKYFQFSFYITVPAESLEELNNITSKLESTLGSLLLISKVATLQMEDAFQSSIPAGMDKLMITRNMDTTSLATTFPFTSSDLTMDEGIMYGINRHNGSLVIFERFSMENANTVVFAKSGAGKSYFVKLEALRLMIFGAEVMIIDPEEEYRMLCEAVGGNYIDFSANSPSVINPFDLSGIAVEGENELGIKILSLMTLFKLMLNGLNQTEEAILDRALMETYRLKGITTDPDSQARNEPPVMEDLYKVLMGGAEPESRNLAERLEKFIKGSMTGIFDKQSTIDINNKMTVFSTKNLEDSLRPIAFYIILDFVWTRIRRDLRKRVLIVEEAWYLMTNEDSAKFIYGIAKRARKYYLGLTTITQDVDDFLTSDYGKAIVSNSSIHVLFKQHPSAIDRVAEVFYLSEGEKRLLLAAGVGEGLFFAGANHVSIKVMASADEHNLITTNPQEILKMREQGQVATPKARSRNTFGGFTSAWGPNRSGTEESEQPPEIPNADDLYQMQQNETTSEPKVVNRDYIQQQAIGPVRSSEPRVVNNDPNKTQYVYDSPPENNDLDIQLAPEDRTVPSSGQTVQSQMLPNAVPMTGDTVKRTPTALEEPLETEKNLVEPELPSFVDPVSANRPTVSNTVGHVMRSTVNVSGQPDSLPPEGTPARLAQLARQAQQDQSVYQKDEVDLGNVVDSRGGASLAENLSDDTAQQPKPRPLTSN